MKICKNSDNANEDPKDKEPVNVEPTKPKVEPPQATGDDIHKIPDSVVPPAPSESLNDLIDKLNKYIDPQTVPDCESKINRLKEILNILDSDVKQTKPKTENMQKDGEIKKPQDIDKEKNSDKEPKKEGDKQKDNHKNNAEEPKVKVDDPQKSQEEETTDLKIKLEMNIKDNEDEKVPDKVPDKVPVEKCSDVKPIKPDKTESEIQKQKEDELNNNTEPNDDQGKQNMQNQRNPDVAPQIPEKDLQCDKKLEPVDLTTQPNTKEHKTVTFKTTGVIAFREEQDKIFDEILEAMECKNNSAANVLDDNQDKFKPGWT